MDKKIRTILGTSLWLEVMFAIYFSFLLVWIQECKPPYAWSIKPHYFFFLHPNFRVVMGEPRLFYAKILLIPAVAIFICLRVIERFSLVRVLLLRTIGGALAVAGWPLVCLYDRGRIFAGIELAIAAFCFLLWAYRKWPVSSPLNVFLLTLHYAFWSAYSGLLPKIGGVPVVWWHDWDYLMFVYPVLGLFFSLAWAVYFRATGPLKPSVGLRAGA